MCLQPVISGLKVACREIIVSMGEAAHTVVVPAVGDMGLSLFPPASDQMCNYQNQ